MSPVRKTLLYFHGGPGLNANPERQLLAPAFHQAGFDIQLFEEPSTKRPNGPPVLKDLAAGYTAAAADFLLQHSRAGGVRLIGHSFGTMVVHYLCSKYPALVSQVILIAPCLNINAAELNVVRLAADDFCEAKLDGHQLLNRYRLELEAGEYAHKREAMNLASQDPHLFVHYWSDWQKGQEFLGHYQEPEFAPEPANFAPVRFGFPEPDPTPIPIPALTIYGADDPVAKAREQQPTVSAAFPINQWRTLPCSRHYPHIEKSAEFLALV